ncbi:MAG: hypothetical protein HY748_08040, partial [Elusimicrobia bacterium]|nr:hypothetical protein [Elusimicrobiota bacterium]
MPLGVESIWSGGFPCSIKRGSKRYFAQDWGQKALSVHFVRDKEKREVDFLLALEGRPLLLVEA